MQEALRHANSASEIKVNSKLIMFNALILSNFYRVRIGGMFAKVSSADGRYIRG